MIFDSYFLWNIITILMYVAKENAIDLYKLPKSTVIKL